MTHSPQWFLGRRQDDPIADSPSRVPHPSSPIGDSSTRDAQPVSQIGDSRTWPSATTLPSANLAHLTNVTTLPIAESADMTNVTTLPIADFADRPSVTTLPIADFADRPSVTTLPSGAQSASRDSGKPFARRAERFPGFRNPVCTARVGEFGFSDSCRSTRRWSRSTSPDVPSPFRGRLPACCRGLLDERDGRTYSATNSKVSEPYSWPLINRVISCSPA